MIKELGVVACIGAFYGGITNAVEAWRDSPEIVQRLDSVRTSEEALARIIGR